MNFETLQAAWQSRANAPSADASAAMLRDAAAALKQRRAELNGLIAFAGVMLAIPLALVGLDALTGQVDAIDLSREWALVPFALVPFVVLFLVARRQQENLQASTDGTLLSVFRALLKENAAARWRTYLIGGAIVLFAPLLAVMLGQMGETGKMTPQNIEQAGIVMGVALVLSLAVMVARYFWRLVPERRRLEALIAQYETLGST